jgi:hypothetical protein
LPDVSGSTSAESPASIVGIPRTTKGSGFQYTAKEPTNGIQREKIREIIEFVPTAYIKQNVMLNL